MFSLAFKLTTASGIKVTKLIDKSAGAGGKIRKVIEYPVRSKLAQLGIDNVAISNVGKNKKYIAAFNGNKVLFSGYTKPECKTEVTVLDKFREYLNAAKIIKRFKQ